MRQQGGHLVLLLHIDGGIVESNVNVRTKLLDCLLNHAHSIGESSDLVVQVRKARAAREGFRS
jgi:hypothetical protein